MLRGFRSVTVLTRQLTEQPGLGEFPVAQHALGREAECLGWFVDCQTTENPQLYDLGTSSVLDYSEIGSNSIARFRARGRADRSGRRAKQPRTTRGPTPIDVLDIDQPQVCFMNQGGGPQRFSGSGLVSVMAGELPKFPVNQRNLTLTCLGIAASLCFQQACKSSRAQLAP